MSSYPSYKNLGFGLGLRPSHFSDVLANPGQVDWFEALTENYMGIEGCGQSPLLQTLLEIRKDHPLVLHCVSTNIGGSSGLDHKFLKKLKQLIEIVEPEWVSDHLCWTGIHGYNSHELLPLPYTEEAVALVSENIHRVQDFLGQRFMIENTSSYMSFNESVMEEWDFIAEIVDRTDCGILLDVNNVFVSSENHDFDPKKFIDKIPKANVGQIHLAGHRKRKNGLIVDTHDQPVCPEVWELLEYTYQHIPHISTMVEWDDNIPSFAEYKNELDKAKNLWNEGKRQVATV